MKKNNLLIRILFLLLGFLADGFCADSLEYDKALDNAAEKTDRKATAEIWEKISGENQIQYSGNYIKYSKHSKSKIKYTKWISQTGQQFTNILSAYSLHTMAYSSLTTHLTERAHVLFKNQDKDHNNKSCFVFFHEKYDYPLEQSLKQIWENLACYPEIHIRVEQQYNEKSDEPMAEPVLVIYAKIPPELRTIDKNKPTQHNFGLIYSDTSNSLFLVDTIKIVLGVKSISEQPVLFFHSMYPSYFPDFSSECLPVYALVKKFNTYNLEQTMKAIQTIHTVCTQHRDLKPADILIDDKPVLFPMAPVDTPQPPLNLDIYSYGVIAYQLLQYFPSSSPYELFPTMLSQQQRLCMLSKQNIDLKLQVEALKTEASELKRLTNQLFSEFQKDLAQQKELYTDVIHKWQISERNLNAPRKQLTEKETEIEALRKTPRQSAVTVQDLLRPNELNTIDLMLDYISGAEQNITDLPKFFKLWTNVFKENITDNNCAEAKFCRVIASFVSSRLVYDISNKGAEEILRRLLIMVKKLSCGQIDIETFRWYISAIVAGNNSFQDILLYIKDI